MCELSSWNAEVPSFLNLRPVFLFVKIRSADHLAPPDRSDTSSGLLELVVIRPMPRAPPPDTLTSAATWKIPLPWDIKIVALARFFAPP